MDNNRKLMQFHLLTEKESATHYHQNPELFYIMAGQLEVRIDDQTFVMKNGDIMLINANKRHLMIAEEGVFGARFEIDFHLLSEYMGTMQLLFWCNTMADKNEAYNRLRILLNRILGRYFEKDEKSSLYLNALYYETMYVLTSNFLIKSDDTRLNIEATQDKLRIQQIQSYIQANYQTQISLNDLAGRLYLSNAYLSKYIKKHFGLTFMEYLNNVRLFHAVDELIYSNKNMTRIALDNGFPTSAAFTKAFRDAYSELPSEYRKKMQNNRQEANTEVKLTEEEAELIKKYLKDNDEPEENERMIMMECNVDATDYTEYNNPGIRGICVGKVYSLLHSDVQKQLIDIQKKTGVEYIRVWDLFSREHCYSEGGCNFRKLDQVFDFLVDNEMKPYIELGYKQTVFMYSPERYLKQSKNQEDFDDKTFEELIRDLVIHLVNRYGVDEIERWYFEYRNSQFENWEKRRGFDSYYRRFLVVYRTLKEVSSRIKIGGAGYILGYETMECRKTFPFWMESEVKPDFFSVYAYQYTGYEEDKILYGRKSIDFDYMKNQIEILREGMKESGFDVEEFHITEWNFTISNRNVINDSCEQGAYVLKNCIDMCDQVDFMAYWHALDSYSDYYDVNEPLNGDSGIISRDGFRKPAFYALSFMKKLQPYLLYKGSYAIVTSNLRDCYVIACHNFKKFSGKYASTEENDIKIDEIANYLEDQKSLTIRFRLTNVNSGDYIVKTHYVNREHGSVQDIWKRLEYRKNLAKDEKNYLQNSAIPYMEIKNIHVNDGVLEFENKLQEQEIRLIEIKYCYTL